jgi:predicted PurR-regulated permease PerM
MDDRADPVAPPDQPLPGVSAAERPTRVRSRALNVLVILAAVSAVYVAKPILLPALAALLVSLLLRPLVRQLDALRIPTPIGTLLVMGLISTAAVLMTLNLLTPLQEWIDRTPQAVARTRDWLNELRAPVKEMTRVVSELEAAAAMTASNPNRTVEVKNGGLASGLWSGAREVVSLGGMTLVIAYFILACGGPLIRTLLSKVPHLHSDQAPAEVVLGTRPTVTAEQVMHEVEWQMFHYLGAITLINLGLGLVIGVLAAAFGLPNPLLWGAMFFALNYVPYLGPSLALILLAFAAFAGIPDPRLAVCVPLIGLLVVNLEGQVLTPFVLGRAFAINPLIILLWTVFLIWLWGIAGAFLAVPLLVLLRVLAARVGPMNWVVQMLDP